MLVLSLFEYNESYTHNNWWFYDYKLSFNKIYYILGGSGYYKDAEHDLKFEKGHLYILPANVRHSMYDDPHDKLNHLYLHIYTAPILDKFIDKDLSKDVFLSDLITLIRKNAAIKGNNVKIKYLVEVMINYILDQEKQNESVSAKVKNYIDANVREQFSMEDIAAHFGYSASQIVKSFKNAYLVTPKQYYKTLRFEQIIKDLQSGMTCEEITRAYNYSSAANLSRDFKTMFSLSPQNYLKLHSPKK